MVPRSTFSEGAGRRTARPGVVLALGTVMCVSFLSCRHQEAESPSSGSADGKWNRSAAEIEYRFAQIEMQLAQKASPYLVLDLNRGQLLLKLKGTIVWNYPMEFAATDKQEVRKFAERFRDDGKSLARPIIGKHLFAAKDKTPDSILAIVGKVVRVAPELLQRELPEHFLLSWGDGLVLEIHTDITGAPPISKFQNAMAEVRKALQRPFGGVSLVIKVDLEKALTLYRATRQGMPTLVIPPT